MRILMTTDTVGGVWTYALQLARSLAAHDVTVDLATLGAPLSDSQWESARALRNVNIHESAFRLEWMEDPWEDVRAAGTWLLGMADEIQPDIVHLNDYSQGTLDWPAPVLVVGHSCVLSWHKAVRGRTAGPEWNRYREHVTRGLRGADLVVAPTAAMLECLETLYEPLSDKAVIPNGRDGHRERRGDKRPIVLTAGRLWDEAKNIAMLAKAARDIDWRVYVAGEAEHPDGGAAGFANVTPLGRLDPVAMDDWFRAASIYVHPARYEPFGLAPLEAALRGCTLVVADIPTLREVWGDAALYVSPEHPEDWADLVNRLIENSSLRRDYAARARRRASYFTARRMARSYLNAYRRLSMTPRSAAAIAIAGRYA